MFFDSLMKFEAVIRSVVEAVHCCECVITKTRKFCVGGYLIPHDKHLAIEVIELGGTFESDRRFRLVCLLPSIAVRVLKIPRELLQSELLSTKVRTQTSHYFFKLTDEF